MDPAKEERRIDPVLIIALIAWILVFGFIARHVAKGRDRSSAVWFVFGAVLGPIAIELLVTAPPGRCRSCLAPTQGWLTTCAWCREDVRMTSKETRTILVKMGRSSEVHDRVPVGDRERRITVLRTDKPAGRPAPIPPSGTPTRPPVPLAAAQPSGFGLPRVRGLARSTQDAPAHSFNAPTSTVSGTPTDFQPSGTEAAVLGTATYITGSSGLEPGRRYTMSLHDARLRLLGPVEIDPSAIALELDVAYLDARTMGGRLLISQTGGQAGSVLAFMSIAGTTPDGLAASVVEAARAAREA